MRLSQMFSQGHSELVSESQAIENEILKQVQDDFIAFKKRFLIQHLNNSFFNFRVIFLK
jgi:hypothetical protein